VGATTKNLHWVGLLMAAVISLVPCSAQTQREQILRTTTAYPGRDGLIQSKLPPGKTIVTATDPELLDAVCNAVKQSPAELASIVRTVAPARKRLQMDIFCKAVRCASERGALDCNLVNDILRQWTRERPDEAAHLLELALSCAPNCRDGLPIQTGAGQRAEPPHSRRNGLVAEGGQQGAKAREIPEAAPPPTSVPEFAEEQPTPPPKRTFARPIAGTPPPPKTSGDKAKPQSEGEFPFPPPQASAFEEIPREMVVGRKAHPLLRDAEAALAAAFVSCGYGEKSYHPIPDGFAMASRVEQINADGAPAANRWSLEVSPISEYSLEGYFKALFYARPGRYRVIVFVVTNHPFSQTEEKVDREEAGKWTSHGMNKLPKEIGDREYSDDYACTALIYEFRLSGNGKTDFVEPSQMTGRTHLEKAGILAALARPTRQP
jgi:hypothetical protein